MLPRNQARLELETRNREARLGQDPKRGPQPSSQGVHTISFACGDSKWLCNIQTPKTIRQPLNIMSMRLTTIVKPPSIIRVELMKRRGIMPTLPMATQGIMQRKLVNITNTAQKISLYRRDCEPWLPILPRP